MVCCISKGNVIFRSNRIVSRYLLSNCWRHTVLCLYIVTEDRSLLSILSGLLRYRLNNHPIVTILVAASLIGNESDIQIRSSLTFEEVGLVYLSNVNLSGDHGVYVGLESADRLADLFRGVNLSLGFLNLGIDTALGEAAELSIIPEFDGSTFSVALFGDCNHSFSPRLVAVSIQEHHQISVTLDLS